MSLNTFEKKKKILTNHIQFVFNNIKVKKVAKAITFHGLRIVDDFNKNIIFYGIQYILFQIFGVVKKLQVIRLILCMFTIFFKY